MELFYTQNIRENTCVLDEQESRHCVKVLRHREGDTVHVIDGLGTLMECKIITAGKNTELEIISRTAGFGSHPYVLHMAVAPTKNIDRYEWFLEKATEIGVDCITPVMGEHSERKVLKPQRFEKILLSAAKQSLKGTVPALRESCSVEEFIRNCGKDDIHVYEKDMADPLKLIAWCGNGEKFALSQAVSDYIEQTAGKMPYIIILIGPEGDFSEKEVHLALQAGFQPIHLGASRLRTETAAVVAASGIYFISDGSR